jgi:uncharacterized protein (DUF1778 family)
MSDGCYYNRIGGAMAVQTKSERVTFRVTPAQAELLRAGAEKEGEWLSEWIRRLALAAAATRLSEQNPRQHTTA